MKYRMDDQNQSQNPAPVDPNAGQAPVVDPGMGGGMPNPTMPTPEPTTEEEHNPVVPGEAPEAPVEAPAETPVETPAPEAPVEPGDNGTTGM